jgi:hypothetical protein
MGLIGLFPGSPVRYDAEHERVIPAHGERLQIEVRYSDDGRDRSVPLEAWMTDLGRKAPPGRIEWVFAGSRTLEDGRFAADPEGTVICVVDFEAALIAPAALHSADNELLWLAANTEAIPPLDTPCTIIIRSARGPATIVELLEDARVRIDAGDPLSGADAIARLADQAKGGARPRLIVRSAKPVPDAALRSFLDRLAEAGWDRHLVELAPMVSPGVDEPRRSEPRP